MADPVAPLTGRCLCGAVELSISEALAGARYCHCTRCQRRTGTAFSLSGLTQPGSLSFTRGADVVREFRPEDGWVKAFCSACGSQLYTTSPDDPDQLAVRFGILDADPGVRPTSHQFVDYAAPWDVLPDDGLPRHGERAPSWE